jgi:hypothetical protein
MAVIVFPHPPFWLTIAMVLIGKPSLIVVSGALVQELMPVDDS